MLYIFDKDDNFKNIITEDTGLIDTWFKDYQNHLIDEPFVFHVDSESELLPLIVAENQVAFKHTFNALQQDVEMLKLMRIKEIDEIYNNDGYIVEVTCEPSWLELYDHFIEDRRIENGTAQTAMNRALQGSRWLGQVAGEFGNGSTNFYWIDAVEALFKIAEEWGGTLQDYITLDENNEIATRIMYLLPRLGRDNGLLIQPDYNAETIERRTLSYPVTAIWGQGASLEIEDDEGQHTGGYTRYITFEDVEWKKSKGDPVDKPKGQKWVGDPDALAKYGYKQVEKVYLLDYTTLEIGTLTSNTGNETSAPGNNRIRSGFIDFVDSQDIVIDAIPSTDIQINVYSYDSNERFISHSNYLNLSNNIEYTLPVNARYVRFVFKTINNEIITVSNIRDISIRFNFFNIMHRFGHFSNQDYETPEELLWATWEALQEEKDPEIYHEAVIDEVDKPIFLGDTGTILDRHYGKPIEVQSQITGLEYDILRPMENVKTVLGNYKDMSRDPLEDEIDEIKQNQKRPVIVDKGNFRNKKPMKPTNVEAVGGWETIQVTWDYTDEIYVSHYEVYASQNKDFVPDSQFLVYNGKVSAFGHEVKTDEVWYYRVCAVNYHGVKSEFSDEATASTIRIPLDATNFESIVTDAKNRADEAYDNANIATQNAVEAIGIAQEGFDKSLEAIDGLTTLTEFVDDNTGEIATIKGDVQGLQTTVSKKVDESTFNTFVQQTNNSLAGKISMTDAEGVFVKGTEFSATIDGLQTTVSNKADKSTVTQLAGVVDTKISTVDANNKFATQSQLTQTASSLTSTITSVKNDLDGLEIGGRNLMEGTSDKLRSVVFGGWTGSFSPTGTVHVGSDNVLQPNDEAVASVFIKSGDQRTALLLNEHDGSTRIRQVTGNYIPANQEGYSIIKFKVSSNATRVILQLRHDSSDTPSDTKYYKELLLVKGNKATDWSPAPEDMATQSELGEWGLFTISQISQLDSAINLRVKKGDVMSQINIEADRVLISTDGKLVLDAESTLISNAVIKNAHIESLSGEKLISKSVIADKLDVTYLSAITSNLGTVTTGRMQSQNGNIDFNLNNGTFDVFNQGSIRFNNSAGGVRRIQNGRSAILSFPVSAGSTTPMVAVGVVAQTGTINVNDSSFRGIRIHGDNISHENDIVGDVWTFKRTVDSTDASFVVDLSSSRKTISPQYAANYNYDLGTGSNYFDRVYAQEATVNTGDYTIINNHNRTQGFRMMVGYQGENYLSFYGLNAGPGWINPRYYALGKSSNRFSQIFLLNEPNVNSDKRLKENIADNTLGLDFINDLETVTYNLIDDPVKPMNYGVLAQDVESVLQAHGVDTDNISLVEKDERGYYSMQPSQLVFPLIKSVQELDDKIVLTREELVLKIAKLEQRISELESVS